MWELVTLIIDCLYLLAGILLLRCSNKIKKDKKEIQNQAKFLEDATEQYKEAILLANLAVKAYRTDCDEQSKYDFNIVLNEYYANQGGKNKLKLVSK